MFGALESLRESDRAGKGGGIIVAFIAAPDKDEDNDCLLGGSTSNRGFVVVVVPDNNDGGRAGGMIDAVVVETRFLFRGIGWAISGIILRTTSLTLTLALA